MRFNRLIIVVLIASLFACIEQIEVFEKSSELLVVDGLVTNNSSDAEVRLTYTKTYNTPSDYGEIRRARVSILDDSGNTFPLEYTERGIFITTNFQGIVGRSYHIEIVFEDGREYVSTPELMQPVPEVQDFHYRRENNQIVFSIDLEDPSEVDNYYRWRYSGTYEVFSPVAFDLRDNEDIILSRTCYSWGVQPDFSDVYQCWVKDFDREFLNIADDRLLNGRAIEDYTIYDLELNNKFNYGYYALVEQMSLTKAAYEYWDAIKQQYENGGTIFETTNYQIIGNIEAVDSDEVVLGYFGASAVKQESLFIDQFIGTFQEVPCETNEAGCYPMRCVDCRAYGSNSVNVKPDFWPVN